MTVPTITGAPETWPLAATRCYFRGHLMDYETAAVIMAAEAQLGYELTVEQGCYNAGGVAASAGTHDGGGVFDLAPWDFERKVKVLRSLGCAAWHRTPDQGPWGEHIHAVIRNHPTLSAAAKNQQAAFDRNPRHNGLANNLVDRDQYPGRPTPTFHYPPKAPVVPTFQAVGLNDDWANLKSDVVGLIADVRPLVMGVQEGYRVDYAKALKAAVKAGTIPDRWLVKQVETNEATAGVALIWDHHKLKRHGHHRNDPTRRGSGIQPIGKGADTRMRPVLWRDLEFRPNIKRGNLPHAFRAADVHYPPQRDRAAWAAFDAALELWVKASPLPVILFMDSNQHGGPDGLLSGISSRYAWHGVGEGIDGCVTSLPVRGVKDLPKRTSDHNPVVITLG